MTFWPKTAPTYKSSSLAKSTHSKYTHRKFTARKSMYLCKRFSYLRGTWVRRGDSDVGYKVMLMTWWWWPIKDVGDRIILLTIFSLYWYFFNAFNRSPTSCHQHIPSPTAFTNIYVTFRGEDAECILEIQNPELYTYLNKLFVTYIA